MKDPILLLRLVTVAASGLLAARCSHSPTAATPPPVDAPKIICPIDQNLTSPLGTPITAVYGAPTVAGGLSPVTTACLPISGSVFPIGPTVVSCTATDANKRANACSFNVTVVMPPQISLTRFVAFGDSITYGEDGTNALTSNVGGRLTFLTDVRLAGFEYPTVLAAELRGRYTMQASAILVGNQGITGERAGDPLTLTRFSSALAGSQAVLLLEGANDLADAYAGIGNAVTNALTNLQTMLVRARTAGVRPYLATLPPQDSNSLCIPQCRGFAAALVPPFNSQLATIARANGVALVDVYTAFAGDLTLLSTDGLHPNALGYQRIADTFFQTLKSTLELTPAPSTLAAPTTLRR